jgi:hypothetical protein
LGWAKFWRFAILRAPWVTHGWKSTPGPDPVYYGCGCGCTHGCNLTPTPAPNGSGTRGHPHPRVGLPSLVGYHPQARSKVGWVESRAARKEQHQRTWSLERCQGTPTGAGGGADAHWRCLLRRCPPQPLPPPLGLGKEVVATRVGEAAATEAEPPEGDGPRRRAAAASDASSGGMPSPEKKGTLLAKGGAVTTPARGAATMEVLMRGGGAVVAASGAKGAPMAEGGA